MAGLTPGRRATSQSRQTCALRSVSAVVKDLDTTTKSVVSGSEASRTRAASTGSTLLMNRSDRPAAAACAAGSERKAS